MVTININSITWREHIVYCLKRRNRITEKEANEYMTVIIIITNIQSGVLSVYKYSLCKSNLNISDLERETCKSKIKLLPDRN